MAKKKNLPKRQNRITSVTSIVLLIILVVLVSSLATLLIIKNTSHKPFETKRLAYDFTVTNGISLVLDTDILHFGGGPAGARLQRSLNVTTSKDAKLKISWIGDGNIVVSENNFMIYANESKDLLFYLDIPSNASQGSYSGELILEFYH